MRVSLSACAAPREIGIALAHCIVSTPLHQQDRHTLLNKLFTRLTIGQQMRCLGEINACRAAKRRQHFAVVA